LFLVIAMTALYAIILKRFAARGISFSAPRGALLLGVMFGLYAILATLNCIPMPNNSLPNVRDAGPLLAGLLGGPLAGLLAGFIGGVHRIAVNSAAPGIPCGIAAMLAGFIGGLLHLRLKGNLPSLYLLCALAFGMEGLHMVLVMLIVPAPQNFGFIAPVTIPMMLANAAALGLFSLLYREPASQAHSPLHRHALG